MSTNYWEHPSYGKENRNDKVITLTLSADMTPAQWTALYDEPPQLDVKLEDLSYCDGESDGASDFSHDWEKTDTCPRGLIGYSFSKNKIRVWASEAVSSDCFLEAANYVLSEVIKIHGLASAKVLAFDENGHTTGYGGSVVLGDIANFAVSDPVKKASETKAKPKFPGSGGGKVF